MAPRKNSKRSDSTSDSGPEEETKPVQKKAKTSTARDDDEPSWSLDSKRQVKVREFRGKIYVDIREYYESEGELKPGKKGISLSVPQWKKLVDVIEDVNKAISDK